MKEQYETFCMDGCRPDGEKKTAKQYLDVNIPVDIKPQVKPRDISMECCGEPVVICDTEKPGKDCRIIIVQKLCVKLPICFSFDAKVGEIVTECSNNSCQP